VDLKLVVANILSISELNIVLLVNYQYWSEHERNWWGWSCWV